MFYEQGETSFEKSLQTWIIIVNKKITKKMQKFWLLGVLHHLTAKLHPKILLWCTQSNTFLFFFFFYKNQQHPLKWKFGEEKQHQVQDFLRTFDIFFFFFSFTIYILVDIFGFNNKGMNK